MIAVGVCLEPDGALAKDQLGLTKNSWAWRVDGMLWAHGVPCSPSYGTIKTQHLLTDGDVVTVTLDVHAQTLAFGVNGRDLGLAFGPPGSGAEAEVPVINLDPYRVFFPAVSLHNYNDKVRIRPGGTMGTLALPWLLDLENTLMTVGSRLSSTVTAGPGFTPEEAQLEKWMQSPVFARGMERRGSPLAEPTGLPEDVDLQENWDIGEEEFYLGSPERRASCAHGFPVKSDAPPTDSGSQKEYDRFIRAVLPQPAEEGEKARMPETLELPSREYQLMLKWVDSPGSSRITKRLAEVYPVVPLCEAYCLAAFLKVTGLWREGLRVIDRHAGLSGSHKVSMPALTAETRQIGRKLQELRLVLLKKHQQMKEEEQGGDDRESTGGSRSTSSSFSALSSSADAYGLIRTDSSSNISTNISLASTTELDFSSAVLDLDRSDSTPGTPTLDELQGRGLALRRRLSVGPEVSAFACFCNSVLEHARFLLELKCVDAADGDPAEVKRLLQLSTEFLTDGEAAPVATLRLLLERRLARATYRRFGLRCYRALLMASTYSSVQVHAIRHLKAALGAQVTQAIKAEEGKRPEDKALEGPRELTSAVEPFHGRHHYLKGLEACPEHVTEAVRKDFSVLFTFLLTLLKKALLDKNVTLACYILSAWSLDFEGVDSQFLLDAKILKSMHSLLSLSRLSRCITAGIVITENHGLNWTAWPVEDVRSGLAQGRITKRIVIEHMRSAPEQILPRGWWQRVGLAADAGDIDVLVARLKIGDVIVLYESMLWYVNELRNREKAELALADTIAKEEARRKKGIRYTYIVTATNGVGVRQLPDTRAERTGEKRNGLPPRGRGSGAPRLKPVGIDLASHPTDRAMPHWWPQEVLDLLQQVVTSCG
jgi:hypothetical protein